MGLEPSPTGGLMGRKQQMNIHVCGRRHALGLADGRGGEERDDAKGENYLIVHLAPAPRLARWDESSTRCLPSSTKDWLAFLVLVTQQ